MKRVESVQFKPYLSVVVTSRNDNHGEGMLGRMQAFLDCLLDQAIRYQICIEVIIVEWNPPKENPYLSEVLHWPIKESSYFKIRIIEVPPELHQQYRCANTLGLYQMIAKNVGIRRANGEYILATNIDILFSEELMTFFKKQKLKEGIMYRVDRFDVPSIIPNLKSIQQKLKWCHQKAFMVSDRQGSFFVKGVKSHFAHWTWEKFNNLKLFVKMVFKGVLIILGGIILPVIRFLRDNFNVWSIFKPTHRKEQTSNERFWRFFKPSYYYLHLLKKLKLEEGNNSNIWHLIKSKKLKGIKSGYLSIEYYLKSTFYQIFQYISIYLLLLILKVFCFPYFKRLHTNACGDFTLMHKNDWFKLGAYAEFDMYSFHIDSLIMHQGYRNGLQEKYLRPPKCIFHIEHSKGSGWTPQGETALFDRLDKASVPYLDSRGLFHWISALWSNREGFSFNDASWGLAKYSLKEMNPVQSNT